jgi:hypothetical protein
MEPEKSLIFCLNFIKKWQGFLRFKKFSEAGTMSLKNLSVHLRV